MFCLVVMAFLDATVLGKPHRHPFRHIDSMNLITGTFGCKHQFLGFLGPKGEEPVPEAFQTGLDEIVERHTTGVAVLSRCLFELLELIAKADCLSSDDYCGMCHVCPLF